MGTSRRAGYPVLSRTGFSDHTFLAHPERQQGLAERIVDLVGTGVIEVFTLEPNAGPAG